MPLVLVTGGSGYIAGHVIAQLVAAGHAVRTTVRAPEREATLRASLAASGVADAGVQVAVADLLSDAGWRAAADGCDTVLHVASPVPPGVPKHEDELILPARDGTLRVLRAARDAGVRRVVITSSFAAVGYGQPERTRPFDESDWTVLQADSSAYAKSKTLAERAAWDFVADGRGAPELVAINPVGVFGPVPVADYSSSIGIVTRMLAGKVPFCPRLYFGIVDVRDLADLHLRAMRDPRAAGQRFLATAGDFLPMIGMARILRQQLGAAARRVPSIEVPDAVVRLLALVHPVARGVLPELGKRKNASSAKAREWLGWSPRSADEALVATARDLIRLGEVT